MDTNVIVHLRIVQILTNHKQRCPGCKNLGLSFFGIYKKTNSSRARLSSLSLALTPDDSNIIGARFLAPRDTPSRLNSGIFVYTSTDSILIDRRG